MDSSYPILFVDDDHYLHEIMRESLQDYAVDYVFSAEEALRRLAKHPFEIVITDIEMPGMNGIELSKIIARDYKADIIVMTGNDKDYAYAQVVAQGAREFIHKPFQINEFILRLNRVISERKVLMERNAAEQGLKEVIKKQTEVINEIIQAISFIIEIRDPYTAGHQTRVADLACAIAKEMGFSEERIHQINLAGIIHDLGKIAVPSEILCKPGRLDQNEFGIIKAHPQVAFSILNKINFNWPIARIVYQHHEKLDGSGYPLGLTGPDILIEAMIITVADVVEAIASHRPYRPSLGLEVALDEITSKSGAVYHAPAVDACVKVLSGKSFVLGN